jgi:hypothetical protein
MDSELCHSGLQRHFLTTQTREVNAHTPSFAPSLVILPASFKLLFITLPVIGVGVAIRGRGVLGDSCGTNQSILGTGLERRVDSPRINSSCASAGPGCKTCGMGEDLSEPLCVVNE